MISLLTGVVAATGPRWCVLDVAGVGYRVEITPATSYSLHSGEKVTLHTSLVVREDSMTLFGFPTALERDAFILAQSTSGIGPKGALEILATLTPQQLVSAITSEDLGVLSRVSGIGKKTAEKLILELRDKIKELGVEATGAAATPAASGWREQVSQGLQSLSWSPKDAERACDAVAPLVEADPDIPLGNLIKAALASLAKS